MAINIGANFAYQGKQPNFARDSFATKAAMKAFAETSIDEGHLSYCAEDGNMYQFKSSNAPDDTTGRWRMFKSGNQVAVTVDSVLSSTSTNPVQNKIIKAELDKKMPKGAADYIATGDLTSLPITEGVIDLNGYSISTDFNKVTGTITIQNGTINTIGNIASMLNIINCLITSTFIYTTTEHSVAIYNTTISTLGVSDNVNISIYNSNIDNISLEGTEFNIFNSCINKITTGQSGLSNGYIYNSYIYTITCDDYTQVSKTGQTIYLYNSYVEDILLNDYDDPSFGINLCSSVYADVIYNWGNYTVDKGVVVEFGYSDSLNNNVTNAPTTKAVYDALQLKADKTQLSSYVTTTTANNTYLSKTDASNNYAKKSDITTVYKFKGSVKTYDNLPIENRTIGDTYNIEAADSSHDVKAGDNLAWNGSAWDNLSGTVDLSAYATTSAMNTALSKKVDVVTGKSLSTNDFTNDYKTKLDGIAANANNYSLPTASSSTLGGVKVGSNLAITNGVLSVKPTISNDQTIIESTGSGKNTTIKGYGVTIKSDMDNCTITTGEAFDLVVNGTGIGKSIANLKSSKFGEDTQATAPKQIVAASTTGENGEYPLVLRTIEAADLPTMGAASASAAGKSGIVPAPGIGKQASFLRGDGTWAVPTDTKYTLPVATTTTKGGVIVGTNLSVDNTGKISVSTSTTVGKGDTKPVTSDAVSSAISGVSVGLSSCLDRVSALEKSTTNIANGAVYMGVAAPTAAGTAELKPAYKCYYLINSAGNYSQFGSEFTESKLTDYFNAGLQITAYWDGKSWILGDAGLASSFAYVLGGELIKYVPLENTDNTTIKAPNVTISSTASGGKTTIGGYGVVVNSDMDDLTITLGTGHKATINGKEIATTDLITALTNRVSALETALTSLQSTVNSQPKQVVLTQAAYDALSTKDSNTIYYING